MADIEAHKITKALERRSNNRDTLEQTAKEIAKLTGLNMDVARAFSKGWTTSYPAKVRGYKVGEFPKKKGSTGEP